MRRKSSALNDIDQQILALLKRDGRMSYTDIGKETGLSTSAAQQRVLRLERIEMIKGYTAVIADPMQPAIERVVDVLRNPDTPPGVSWTYDEHLHELAAEIVRAVNEPTTTRLLARLHADGPTRITDLAEAEQCSQPTITNHVKRLESSGLVERRADPSDGRAWIISLTEAGEQHLAELA